MVLTSELGMRVRTAPEDVGLRAAVGTPAPPDPRGARGPSCNPSTARSEPHRKRVGHPVTAAIGRRPGEFQKKGNVVRASPMRDAPHPPGIGRPFHPPPSSQPRESRAAFVGARPPTAGLAAPYTRGRAGRARVQMRSRVPGGACGGRAGTWGARFSARGKELRETSSAPRPRPPPPPHTNLV